VNLESVRAVKNGLSVLNKTLLSVIYNESMQFVQPT